MKARPILFSAPMVRALLDGSKTQTRRAIKAPTARGSFVLSFNHGVPEFNFGPDDRSPNDDLRWHNCPYGQPGDLLWVRESHYIIGEHAGPWPGSRWTHYAADLSNNLGDIDRQWTRGWKPSIHMPRASSRLTLRITDVRVQRLKDICGDDCIAEGVWRAEDKALGRAHEAEAAYMRLWDEINGPGSSSANPWVWAITFEVIKANVDSVIAGAQP